MMAGPQAEEYSVKGTKGQASLVACLAAVARAMGVPAEEAGVARAWAAGDGAADGRALARFIARELTLRAKIVAIRPEDLPCQPVPAIAGLKDGGYVVLGKNDAERVRVFDPAAGKTRAVEKAAFLSAWDGRLIVLAHPLSVAGWARKYNLDWFLPALARYKRFLGEALVGSFFLQLFGLATPLFTQVIIDKVILHRGVATLDVLAVFLLVTGVFQAGMGILRTYLLTHTTNKLDVILGARLFRHIAALPLRYFEQRRVGDTLMRVAAMNGIREFMTGPALTAVIDTVFAVVFVAVMFYYSVSLTLLALAVVPVYLLLNVLATPAYKERLAAVWAAGAAQNAFLVEAVTGIQTVKALALEPQFNHRWERLVERYVRTSFDSAAFNITVSNGGRLLQLLSGLSILWFGGHMVIEGELTLGQLIAFQMLAGQAGAPLFRLVGMWQSVQQAALSLERVGDIVRTPPEPVRAGTGERAPLRGAIGFEQVSFRYGAEGPDAVHGVSFAVLAGMRVGVVGRSGSGKSTLAKLVQRLYQPERGRITIDGRDAAELDPVWLRRRIGVVPQESYLFNGSVRDNIAVTRPGAAMGDVVRAAEAAGAHEFILELPEGYDTWVGERGAALSGGQRQRIAIARALLADPRILIFDEATSALDYQSERIISRNLDKIAAGRTLLMIAHRLSSVRKCDTIIVLDRGQLVEQGSHQELLTRRGLYHHLYQMQTEV
ncbi:peptidase domain-containing ABC transporter [Anaeroselena agilis]|uniref:Type I secretion system permease/ATPase n=1 Tax=Anaeroselena agilis TaxID=3063788 RepID=A0ABU3NTP8_9FIRM|nr:type I secretion system permease/ATPase [Selenomonadales bacterium 4137-cl]